MAPVSPASPTTWPSPPGVRQGVTGRLRPRPAAARAFCGVVGSPRFGPAPATGRPVFAHHPFTSPHPEDVAKLEGDPLACRALHYDAVYNGHELGSGSIRITDPAVQRRVFAHLGLTPAEAEARFGFLLAALAAGAPPHGGFAIGFDRVTMRSEEHTSELQSQSNLVCRLLLEKKKQRRPDIWFPFAALRQ